MLVGERVDGSVEERARFDSQGRGHLGDERDDSPAQALGPRELDGCVEGEDRRSDPLDRRVEIVDGELHSLSGLGIEQAKRRLEREPDREELLDDRVVQVHRDALTVLEKHEVPHPRVQPCVLDRDAGCDSECHHELLVDVAERVLRALVGEVQVPEDLTAHGDGHSEERPHRWVVRGEAEAVGMLAKVGKPDRSRLADQEAEDAVTLRQVADLGSLLGVDAHGEELRQERPGRVEHSECPVLGIGQLGRRFDDALEGRSEVEVGADRDDGA